MCLIHLCIDLFFMVHFSVLAFLMSLFIRTHHQTNLVHTSQTYMICQHYSDFIWRWCFLPSAHILCLYFVFLGVKQSYLLTMSFHNIFIISAVPSCCSCCEDGVTDFSAVKVGTHKAPLPSPLPQWLLIHFKWLWWRLRSGWTLSFGYPFHPCVTTVAHKRSWSLYKKNAGGRFHLNTYAP